MGARADEVEAFDVLAAVVRPEPGALCNPGLVTKGSPFDRVQSVVEILRRQQSGGDDATAKAG